MNEDISRNPLNAPGRYYVDCNCIYHECCVEAAPNNFKIEELSAYVFKQPDTAEEEAQCRQALEECPMEAIHDDGDQNNITKYSLSSDPGAV